MSKYPRLAEKFGKRYSWKYLLNPSTNLNERCHPKIGELCSESRDSYHRQWRHQLRKRARPMRQLPYPSQKIQNMRTMPGQSTTEPKPCEVTQRVANCLSKVRTPQLSEIIDVGDIVGSGIEGVVRPGYKKQEIDSNCWENLSEKFSNKLLAIKSVEKKATNSGSVVSSDETDILDKICTSDHPHVTPFLHCFESPVRYHIVTEYNEGGDLFTYLQDNDFRQQDEAKVASVIMQILCATLYIHEQGFVHLDLKLENVMRKERGQVIDSGGISLIDFGHTSKLPVQNFRKLSYPVGSPSYAAPEIVLDKKYSVKSDAWSIGVIMYILLQGYLPFPHLQQKKWREFSYNDYGNFDKNIEENDPFLFEADWENISNEARNLCQSLLTVDTEKRMTVEEAIDSPWFKKFAISMTRNDEALPVMKSTKSTDDSKLDPKPEEIFSSM